MHRRMLLLFTLFVVTAWFYSSVTNDATGKAVRTHQQQIKMLGEAEKALSGGTRELAAQDQG